MDSFGGLPEILTVSCPIADVDTATCPPLVPEDSIDLEGEAPGREATSAVVRIMQSIIALSFCHDRVHLVIYTHPYHKNIHDPAHLAFYLHHYRKYIRYNSLDPVDPLMYLSWRMTRRRVMQETWTKGVMRRGGALGSQLSS